MAAPRPRSIPWIACFVAALGLHCDAAPRKALVELTHELRGSGDDYDDPCFWQDPLDPARALGCITSKGRRQVECFDLATGVQLEEVARGFEGRANNCDIDSARAEMATTDDGGEAVRIHALPSLRLLRSLEVPGATDLGGVCFGRDGERAMLFVTDESTGRVIALDAQDGAVVREWAHGMSEAEGIACDDGWRRVLVCDDHSVEHGCRAFGYDGRPGPEFGRGVLDSDAEGVALYRCGERDGYVIVSDQRRSEFEVFRRDDFRHVCTFAMRRDADLTHDTDGIDILQSSAWPEGLFGACDGCRPGVGDELHLAPWAAIAEACDLAVCAAGGAAR